MALEDGRTRILRLIAAGTWLVMMALALAVVWMILNTLDRTSDQWGPRGYEAVLGVSMGSTGALVAFRRPRSWIGWIILAPAVVTVVQGVLVQWIVVAEAAGQAAADTFTARWMTSWMWVPAVSSFLTVLPLIFPNGHLLGPRWRWALWFALVAPLISIVFIIANTEPFGPAHASNNPAAYFAAVGPRGLIGYGVLWIASFISVSSLVLRYRGAGVEERQQVKWVVYALVLIALGAVVGMTPLALGQLVFVGTALFAAVAIAMAILRYRLYEIDVIINRTLVYGALSAILAGIYTASITLSQRLFVSTTGERSDAAIVFTTLVVVSFFTPVKGRLQSVVDARVRPAAKTPARTASSPDPVPAPLALDLLGRLAGLYASGAITSAEFEAKKTELLARV